MYSTKFYNHLVLQWQISDCDKQIEELSKEVEKWTHYKVRCCFIYVRTFHSYHYVMPCYNLNQLSVKMKGLGSSC